MPLPTGFLEHLQQNGYHPRSNSHSNALARAIVDDLLDACAHLAERANRGELVYQLNFDLLYGTSEWNIDLVLGRPAPPFEAPPFGARIRQANPSSIEIAIELKAVMTEHRKAAKNRKRDLEAHHGHVHNYNSRTIAAGVMLLNVSPTFQSPLKQQPNVHRQPHALVTHCIEQLRSVTESRAIGQPGLDAKMALVVSMDNMRLEATRFHTDPPAPRVGDPLHYDAFIGRLCALYQDRFAQIQVPPYDR